MSATHRAFADRLAQYIRDVERSADELAWPPPSSRYDLNRFALMMLSQAYHACFDLRPDLPVWLSYGGTMFPWGAANPDTVYLRAAVDGAGVYRICGTKGNETIAGLALRGTGVGSGGKPGPAVVEIDLTTVESGPDGRFSLILSTDPNGGEGEWRHMPPGTRDILARRVLSEPDQSDGLWRIERLDRTGPSLLAREGVEDALERTVSTALNFVRFMLKTVQGLAERGAMHRFVSEDFSQASALANQVYFNALYDLSPDDALIIESEVANGASYWGVQLFDVLYNTLDFVHHQSALNSRQVRLDNDGRVRLVVSLSDPGVPNWLDPGGVAQGGILWRWHMEGAFPEPKLRKVPMSEVRSFLPPDTPHTTREDRRAAIAERVVLYQGRRRL